MSDSSLDVVKKKVSELKEGLRITGITVSVKRNDTFCSLTASPQEDECWTVREARRVNEILAHEAARMGLRSALIAGNVDGGEFNAQQGKVDSTFYAVQVSRERAEEEKR
jgi:hypothetical protein